MTIRVLFLCTGNSARSQMAEAFLRKYGGDKFEAHSAGLEPKGMNPFTIQVMEEAGIDVSDQKSKAKEILSNAVIGLVIAFCAYIIIHLILKTLGYNGTWIGF